MSLRLNPRSILCAVALLGVTGANAANWEMVPRVQGGYRYDDNYRLSQPGSEIEVSGAEVDGTLLFRNVDNVFDRHVSFFRLWNMMSMTSAAQAT